MARDNKQAQARALVKQYDQDIKQAERLLTELRANRDAVASVTGEARTSSTRGRKVKTTVSAKRAVRGVKAKAAKGGKRADWNAILKSVGKRFDVAAVLKNKDAAKRGRAQVYPALRRWEQAGLIIKGSDGFYCKVTGATAVAKKTTKPVAKKATPSRATKVKAKKTKTKAAPKAKAPKAPKASRPTAAPKRDRSARKASTPRDRAPATTESETRTKSAVNE